MADTQEPQGGLAGAERPTGMDEYFKARAALVEQQNKLLASLEERNKPQAFDFYASLARGFADPNAKLFSQGLGSAVGNLQDMNERDKAKEMQMYQIRSQVAQQQLDMQRKAMMSGILQKQLSGGSGSTTTGRSNSIVGGLDDQTITLLAAQSYTDPEGVMKTLVSMGVERAKIPEAIKTLQYHLAQVGANDGLSNFVSRQALVDPKAIAAMMEYVAKEKQAGRMTDEAGQKYLDENMPPNFNASPKPAPVSQVVQTPLQSGANKSASTLDPENYQPFTDLPRGVFAGNPADIFKSILTIPDDKTRNEALGSYVRQLGSEKQTTQPTVAQPSVVNSPSGYKPPTAEDMSKPSPLQRAEVATAGLKAEAEAQVKDVTAFRNLLNENFKNSRDRESDADTLISLTNKSGNIFGYFNKPTVANAITALVQGGGTILGLGVKVNELKSALLKAGATQSEIETLQQADFISIRQQLSLASQMKGAVSNFEREIVGKAVASTEDSPNVVRWKSNIVKARAAADREIFNLYQKSPNMTENKFISLPEYKEIQDKLDVRLRANNKAYNF